MPMEFGLAVNMYGAAGTTFTRKAIGNMEGPGTLMCVVIGNIQTVAIDGTEGTGISPLTP